MRLRHPMQHKHPTTSNISGTMSLAMPLDPFLPILNLDFLASAPSSMEADMSRKISRTAAFIAKKLLPRGTSQQWLHPRSKRARLEPDALE
eukprot:CAMPEP_0197886852 /NCGR_PEP_ID=MMETSP1439-20131203/17995_1 /TAXON_ID=66791 /ORGANISM="Gonyaulax spinifera, Strain CCMP409" /LENGTH=90 /DNA_ID=CAMNT_0043506665 /DNA_START=222 /DNA_END=491 /DNA_ORIENTATION=+